MRLNSFFIYLTVIALSVLIISSIGLSTNIAHAQNDDNAYPPGTSQQYKDAKRSGEATVSEDIDAGKWKGYKPPPLPER